MKRLILFLLAILLPLAFSSCNEETPTNNEVKLEEIKCLDSNGNDVEVIQYEIHQSEYIYQNVNVIAFYSDGSKGDVTAFVTFSNIDLTTAGEKKVNVSYKEKVDSFIVNVIEVSLKRIEINTDKVKKIYKLNERFDSSNLIVYQALSNGYFGEIKDYKCNITNQNGKLLNDGIFKKIGSYQVEIEYKSKYAYYKVFVYEDIYDEVVDIDVNDLNIDEFGIHTYSNSESIYSSENCSLTSMGAVELNTFEFDKKYEFVFEGKSFNSYMSISSSNYLRFEGKQNFKMMMILEKEMADMVEIIDDNGKSLDVTVLNGDDISTVLIDGRNGSYTIKSNQRINIKAMFLYFYETEKITTLSINIDDVKTVFFIGESFSYVGLKVYANYNNNKIAELNLNDCDIKIYYNGDHITGFINTGIYDVIIKYQDNDGMSYETKYSILVKNQNAHYKDIELDITDVKVDFSLDESFSYENLKVYGILEEEKVLLSKNLYEVVLYYSDGFVTLETQSFVNIPGNYYVNVIYNYNGIELSQTYDISYDLGMTEYYSEIVPAVEYLENGTINLKIDNVLTSIVTIKFSLYCDGVLYTNFNLFESSISNLNTSKKYILTGYYTGYIDDEKIIVYIRDTEIVFD